MTKRKYTLTEDGKLRVAIREAIAAAYGAGVDAADILDVIAGEIAESDIPAIAGEAEREARDRDLQEVSSALVEPIATAMEHDLDDEVILELVREVMESYREGLKAASPSEDDECDCPVCTLNVGDLQRVTAFGRTVHRSAFTFGETHPHIPLAAVARSLRAVAFELEQDDGANH